MVTRTVATYKVEKHEDVDDLIQRLKNDDRAGALKLRQENRSVQAKIGVGLDVEWDHKFEAFQNILQDNADIVTDAAVVASNDTENRGLAAYYTVENDSITEADRYKESDQERYWGEKAAAYIFSRYDINPNSSMFAPGDSNLD